MKSTVLLSLLIVTVLHSQPRHKKPEWLHQSNGPAFNSYVLVIPAPDSSNFIYYTYRIPYSRLVFVRSGNEYIANFRAMVDLADSRSEVIDRGTNESKVVVEDFNLTNSNSNYLQGFLKFTVPGDLYKLNTVITDLNSKREVPLKPEEISLIDFNESRIYNPIVINSGDYYCSEEKVMMMSNFGGSIPFSSDMYDLLIPVENLETEKLFVTITNREDTVFSSVITDYFDSKLSIFNCDSRIVITEEEDLIVTRNFIVPGINENLEEGLIVIQISKTGEEVDTEFKRVVFWADKPFSLRDPELAIELLEFIENDTVISEILDNDEEEYPRALKEYWAQYDPTPETVFNPIMKEYYSRIDYAAREFAAIGKANGVSTDRGKVYIRFGNPDNIERTSNEQGNVVETWTYSNQDMKFVFVDKKGTGSFTLIEG
ncbi:MAG: GWxTD domain-containing protein [Ignavibacteriaceae bacterium]|nr:GWxTD domain-containing protein [Ignavibacteriaceae bacterium]